MVERTTRKAINRTVAAATGPEVTTGLSASDFVLPGLPVRPEITNRVTLDMFKTGICETSLANEYVDQQLLARLRRLFIARSTKGVTDSGERAIFRAKYDLNNAIYSKIMDEFGFGTQDEASTFWATQWQIGIDTMKAHFETVHGTNSPSVKPELRNKQPADVIELLVDYNTNTELARQLSSNILFTRIAAEIAMASNGLDAKFDELQKHISKKLFAGRIGETTTIRKWGLFNNANQLTGPLSNEEIEDFLVPPGMQTKEIVLDARTIKTKNRHGDPSYVQGVWLTDTKTPSASTEKALRKTVFKKTHLIKPQEQVQDVKRMMFIIDGGGNEAEQVREAIFDIIAHEDADHSHGYPQRFEYIDESKSAMRGKNPLYKRKGLRIYYEGINLPIEIFIMTTEQYVSSVYNVGRKNKQTGEYDGQGHVFFEDSRVRDPELDGLYPYPSKFNPRPNLSRMSPIATQYHNMQQIYISEA